MTFLNAIQMIYSPRHVVNYYYYFVSQKSLQSTIVQESTGKNLKCKNVFLCAFFEFNVYSLVS